MTTLVFDDAQMFNVAKAVVTFNKYQTGNDPRNVVAHMKMIAASTFNAEYPTGYVSTGGWVLTGFHMEGDIATHIYASVNASLFSDLPVPEIDAIT